MADRVVSSLSGGQRRRLDIAMGLIHAPEVLFLDEPSTGLDPQNRANLLEHIRELRARYGTTITGANLLLETQTGAHERMLVTPLRRPALIIGRALKEIVPILAQAVIIVAAAVPFGFRFYVGGAVLGLVILAVFCVGLGSLSYSLALAARNQDWVFWSVQQTLLFPLLLAGILLPIDGGPRYLQTAAQFNPLTYVVDAQRALFNGELIGSTVAGVRSPPAPWRSSACSWDSGSCAAHRELGPLVPDPDGP